MSRRFFYITGVLTIIQFSVLFFSVFYMFRVKNYNVALQSEIDYISDRIADDLIALNIRKTEYSMLASPYSIAKLSEIYLDGGVKRDYFHNQSFRKLDNIALIMNPYNKAVAKLESE